MIVFGKSRMNLFYTSRTLGGIAASGSHSVCSTCPPPPDIWHAEMEGGFLTCRMSWNKINSLKQCKNSLGSCAPCILRGSKCHPVLVRLDISGHGRWTWQNLSTIVEAKIKELKIFHFYFPYCLLNEINNMGGQGVKHKYT